MGKPAIDIDKLAREAANPVKDLDPASLPMRPMFWHVIVEPRKPREETRGGIVIATQTKEAEQYQVTIGKVLAVGSMAFKGKTESGMSLADESIKIAVGDHVLYQRYTGQTIRLRDPAGGEDKRLVILADSEIIAAVNDPDAIRFWI